jgi:hypothetical protein
MNAFGLLSVLAFELPDFEQKLSPQNLGLKLETFTCFPRLPPELRLTIWTFTFPSRRLVDLTLVRPYYGRTIYGRGADPKHPIALHVNRESRAITLQTYHGIFQKQPVPLYANKNKIKPGIRSLFFDPKVDQFCIDSYDILSWLNSEVMLKTYLVDTDLNCFGLIKSVEIRNFRWELTWNHRGWPPWETIETGMMQYLHGLEEIHLVPRIGIDAFEDKDDTYGYLMLNHYFKEERKIDQRRPKETALYLHDYRRRETRSDWDYIRDELVEWPFFNESEEDEEDEEEDEDEDEEDE